MPVSRTPPGLLLVSGTEIDRTESRSVSNNIANGSNKSIVFLLLPLSQSRNNIERICVIDIKSNSSMNLQTETMPKVHKMKNKTRVIPDRKYLARDRFPFTITN